MIARESDKLLSYQGVIAISYTNKASAELKGRCDQLGITRGRSFFGTIDKFCLGEIVAPFMTHLGTHAAELDLIEDGDCPEWRRLKGRAVEDAELRTFLIDSLKSGILPIGALGPAALLLLDVVPQAKLYISSRYTSVYIDEYQDCGIYQHLLMKRLISYGLRGVAVGDIDQAIFRFADKSPDYLVELMNTKEYSHFQLTKNRRCAKAIQAYSLALLKLQTEPIAPDDRRVFAVHMRGDEGCLANGVRTYLHPIMEKYSVRSANEVALIGSSNRTLDFYSSNIGIPNKRFCGTPLDTRLSRWARLFSDLLSSYYDPMRFSGAFIDSHLGIDARPSQRHRGIALVDEFFGLSEGEIADNIGLAVSIARLCEPEAEREGDIEAYRKTVEDAELLTGGFRPARPEEINILTYHKAKGLEFDIVFCLETYQYVMPPYKHEEKPFDAYKQSLAMHYVGITRARKACYILLGDSRHNGKGQLKTATPSEFLSLPGTTSLRRKVVW
jgi:DNA helicase-2/ATP-dependent DNA helicase PcrA